MIVWWRWWWSMMFDGDEWSWHLKCIMTRQMTKSHLKPNKVEAVLWFSTDDAKAIFHCEQSLVDLKWFQFMLMTIFIILRQLRLRSILRQHRNILLNLETGRIDWVQWLSTKAHWHQQNKGLQSLVSIIKSLIVSFFVVCSTFQEDADVELSRCVFLDSCSRHHVSPSISTSWYKWNSGHNNCDDP